MSPNPNTAQRPTHIAIELRLTIEEAEALGNALLTIDLLFRQRKILIPVEQVDPAASAIGKLVAHILQHNPPFD